MPLKTHTHKRTHTHTHTNIYACTQTCTHRQTKMIDSNIHTHIHTHKQYAIYAKHTHHRQPELMKLRWYGSEPQALSGVKCVLCAFSNDCCLVQFQRFVCHLLDLFI